MHPTHTLTRTLLNIYPNRSRILTSDKSLTLGHLGIFNKKISKPVNHPGLVKVTNRCHLNLKNWWQARAAIKLLWGGCDELRVVTCVTVNSPIVGFWFFKVLSLILAIGIRLKWSILRMITYRAIWIVEMISIIILLSDIFSIRFITTLGCDFLTATGGEKNA